MEIRMKRLFFVCSHSRSSIFVCSFANLLARRWSACLHLDGKLCVAAWLLWASMTSWTLFCKHAQRQSAKCNTGKVTKTHVTRVFQGRVCFAALVTSSRLGGAHGALGFCFVFPADLLDGLRTLGRLAINCLTFTPRFTWPCATSRQSCATIYISANQSGRDSGTKTVQQFSLLKFVDEL